MTTAQQLASALGEHPLTLVNDPESPDQSEAGSGMIVRLENGQPVLVRGGIQHERARLPPEEYLEQLYAEWARDLDPFIVSTVG